MWQFTAWFSSLTHSVTIYCMGQMGMGWFYSNIVLMWGKTAAVQSRCHLVRRASGGSCSSRGGRRRGCLGDHAVQHLWGRWPQQRKGGGDDAGVHWEVQRTLWGQQVWRSRHPCCQQPQRHSEDAGHTGQVQRWVAQCTNTQHVWWSYAQHPYRPKMGSSVHQHPACLVELCPTSVQT